MSRHEKDDIAEGHTVVPSHKPMPGVDDEPIDVGRPDTSSLTEDDAGKENKPGKVEPGISPSTEKGRLF
jgi:hypothetical protein